MKVEWRPSALDDRDAIIGYLEPLNPHAAVNLLQALILAGDSLALFPYRGRPGLAAGTRELVAVWPYLIVYEINEATNMVSILRLWHAHATRAELGDVGYSRLWLPCHTRSTDTRPFTTS